jgi:hypothetical protein
LRTLPKPDLGISAKALFELCIQNTQLQSKLSACSSHIEADSLLFNRSFPDSILNIGQKPVLPEGVTGKEMENIYNRRFARKNSPGR